MLQRFRNLVDDVIEVTKDFTVSSTIGEVTRSLTKSDSASQQTSETLTPWTPSEQERHLQATSNCYVYNQDDDKIRLMELLDLRNFGLSSGGKPSGMTGPQDKQAIKVRQIRSKKYQDSDSSDEERRHSKTDTKSNSISPASQSQVFVTQSLDSSAKQRDSSPGTKPQENISHCGPVSQYTNSINEIRGIAGGDRLTESRSPPSGEHPSTSKVQQKVRSAEPHTDPLPYVPDSRCHLTQENIIKISASTTLQSTISPNEPQLEANSRETRPHRSPYPHHHCPQERQPRRSSAHRQEGGGSRSQVELKQMPHHPRADMQYPGFVPIARRSRSRHVTGSAANLTNSRSKESVVLVAGMRRPSSDGYGSQECIENGLPNYRQSQGRNEHSSNMAKRTSQHPRAMGPGRRRSHDLSDDHPMRIPPQAGSRRFNEDHSRARPPFHQRPHSGPEMASFIPGTSSTLPSSGPNHGRSPPYHQGGPAYYHRGARPRTKGRTVRGSHARHGEEFLRHSAHHSDEQESVDEVRECQPLSRPHNLQHRGAKARTADQCKSRKPQDPKPRLTPRGSPTDRDRASENEGDQEPHNVEVEEEKKEETATQSTRETTQVEVEDDIEKLFESFNNEKKLQQAQVNLVASKHCSGSKESFGSCYSSAGEEHLGKINVTGEISFSLSFDYKSNIFQVHVKQCRDLAAADHKKQRSDPYVKSYLLPDKTKNGKRKTKVKKNSLNPVFEEVLKFNITKSELETRTLYLAVWSRETFGRNDFLGEVNIPLDYKSLNVSSPSWHKLQPRVQSSLSSLTYKGDLDVSLKFVSPEHISGRKRNTEDKGELQVVIREARNLTAIRSNGYSDPFCKCYLLPDRSAESKRKTSVVRRSCNPHWNQTVVYENISWEELQERSLELTIWDHDRLTSNDFLGGVRLNLAQGKHQSQPVTWMDANEEECMLWQAMLDRPNCWIEGTLLLRNNMNERK